ncbi:MAG TPA: glycosidase, partial [Chloroflexota bacterium]|nr:glycosidase [Chloroflexota bacterium]
MPGGDALRRARLPVFTVQRLGVVMAPEPGNPLEVEGVLNPAGAVGPDGQYYLFPRLVAAGNYSRIGVARVRRDGDDRPIGVERLGVALEPQMPYELVRPGVGGCEDPRITYLPCANVYVMAYTALGLQGPHVALASSRDLRTWRRHGLVDFAPERSTDFNLYTNKDALLLPEPVVSPSGERALALLHRPIYEMRLGGDRAAWVPAPLPPGIADARPSMWISYCALGDLDWLGGEAPPRFAHHHLLATPQQDWEASRIGGGTVPLPTPDGWLTFYHGVHVLADGGRCYQTGALLLDRADPRQVLARTAEPIFGPEMLEERVGMVGNVVFPTAVEERGGGLDVYYGMADSRIGCAHLP